MKKLLAIAAAIELYLRQRRQWGFALKQEGWVLSTLGQYARQTHHRGPLTSALVLRWAQEPQDASPLWWARRLAIARQFAQFWVAYDSRTQVPPAGVFGPSHYRPPVHIYTPAEVAALLEATASLGPPHSPRVTTFKTLFGLLASTGLRISEALHLRPQDFAPADRLLRIGPSKFSPPRVLPLSASTTQALQAYSQWRQQKLIPASPPTFFLLDHARPLKRDRAEAVFAQLRQRLGWTQPPIPRLHDFRHSLAVNCLVRWNRQPGGVSAHILALSAYLGHRHVADTYWYLSAIPQLLAATSARFEQWAHATPEDPRHA
jgi:integrase